MSQNNKNLITCDFCKKEYDINEINKCPNPLEISVLDNYEKNKTYYFCNSCCEKINRNDICVYSLGNYPKLKSCDRAIFWFNELVKEYFNKNKWHLTNINEQIIDVWASEEHTHGIFKSSDNPNLLLDCIKIDYVNYFEGTSYLFIKLDSEKMIMYDMYMVNELKEIFQKFNCYWEDEYRVNKRGDTFLLILKAYDLSGIVAQIIGANNEYEYEKINFIEHSYHGSKFFNIKKEDGILILDAKGLIFNWENINQIQFVELCRDIFKSRPNIESAIILDSPYDKGEDIEAIEIVSELTGKVKKKWCIQCKKYSRKISPSDIGNVLFRHPELKFDKYCLMTSNYISQRTKETLESWEKYDEIKIKIDIWDKKRIEDYLSTHTDIRIKYFY